MATARSILAVEIDTDTLRAVVFRKGAARWRADAARQWRLDHDDNEPSVRVKSVRRALAEAVEAAGRPAPAVWATLPRGTAFLRAVTVPRVARRELQQLLSLRAAQEIPQFSPEAVIWDYEILPGGDSRSATLNVALCAVRREALERFLADFSAVNVRPEIMDLAPLALARRFSRLGGAGSGGNCALVDVGDSVGLVVRFSNGQPVQFHQTPIDSRAIRAGDAGAAERFALELRYALDAKEIHPSAALGEQVHPAQWIALSGPDDLRGPTLSALQHERQRDVRMMEQCLQAADEAPVIAGDPFKGRDQVVRGLWMRTLAGNATANLMPAVRAQSHWREKALRVASLPALAALAIALALGWGFLGREMQAKKSELVNAAIQEIAPLGPKVDRLKATVDTLRAYEKDRFSWLEVLNELSRIQPREIVLTQLNMEKEGKVVMQGTAPSRDPLKTVEGFQTALNESAFFKEAKVSAVNTRQNREGAVFSLTCILSDAAKKGL